MKKRFLALLCMVVLSLSAFAQNDAFFTYKDIDNNKTRQDAFEINSNGFGMNEMQSYDTVVPVGNGLLLLAGAGLAYAIIRRKEESK